MVHVSTAYCNIVKHQIEELVYNEQIEPDQLLQASEYVNVNRNFTCISKFKFQISNLCSTGGSMIMFCKLLLVKCTKEDQVHIITRKRWLNGTWPLRQIHNHFR